MKFGTVFIALLMVGSLPVLAEHEVNALQASAIRPETPVIGSSETISVPAMEGTLRLAAKVDTGAATSSLHATDIVKFKRDGKEFVRFTTGHGEVKAVMEGQVTREDEVTSSNGTSQIRVFIELPVRIGSHAVQAEFSLTDRSSMMNPVLLGKSLLKNRFLVDVGVDGALSKPMKKPASFKAKEVESRTSQPVSAILNGTCKVCACVFSGLGLLI